MSTSGYRLDEISDDYSVLQAEEIFKATLENSVLELKNPNHIKDELLYLKEFSSKLKFQYLEQETRDKFLRLLLVDTDEHLQPGDVEALQERNAATKKELKQLKNELQALVNTSSVVAEEVLSLHQTFESQNGEIEQALGEVAALEGELEALLNGPANENYKTLFNLNKMIDSDDLGLHEAMEIAQNAVDQDKITLSGLTDKEQRASAERARLEQLESELAGKIRALSAQVETSASASAEQAPEQKYAQWLRELNALLRRFVSSEIVVEHTAGAHVLRVNGRTITLADDLAVLQVDAVDEQLVRRVNYARGDERFWKLSQLLSGIVLRSARQ